MLHLGRVDGANGRCLCQAQRTRMRYAKTNKAFTPPRREETIDMRKYTSKQHMTYVPGFHGHGHRPITTMKHHSVTYSVTWHACTHASRLRWAIYLHMYTRQAIQQIHLPSRQPNGLNVISWTVQKWPWPARQVDGSGPTDECVMKSNCSQATPCSQLCLMCLQECKISKSFGQNDTQVLYTFDDKSQPLDYQSLASNLQTQLGSMMSGYSSQQQVPAAATPTVSITIPTVSSIPSSPATPSTPTTPSSAAASSATGSGTATGK